MGKRIIRTRNLGTATESEFFGKIRSALRRLTLSWKPIQEARKISKIAGMKPIHYRCTQCNGAFRKVKIDHIVPAGSLNSFEDLPSFTRRLFEEDIKLYRALCDPCHQKITNQERKNKKNGIMQA